MSRVKSSRHPVDIYVGHRLRKKRLEMGISQDQIGSAIHVTFQQIQKYEKGYNRISCSKLFEISQFLKIKIGYFFENLPLKTITDDSETPYVFHLQEEILLSDVSHYNPYDDTWHNDPDIKQLVEAFSGIQDRQIKATIISLVKSFVKEK